MRIYTLILIFLSLLFFIIFFYVIITNNNKLIKFISTEEQIYDPLNIIYSNKLPFNPYVNQKNNMCKKEFCDEYHSQKIKYDLCKECKKENKCYDASSGLCVSCKNNYSCEQMYGCNNKPPINPINNFCTRCWL